MAKKKNKKGNLSKLPGWAGYLNKKRFRKELKSASRLQFRPLQKQIQAEKRASKTRKREIGDWFDQYGQSVGRVQAATGNAYQQALAQLRGQSSSAAKFDEQLRQQLAKEDQSDANLRGATYDSTEARRAAQANLARLSSANSFNAMITGQGAAQSAYLADKGRIGEGEKVEQLLRENARSRTLDSDMRDIKRERRDFLRGVASDLRQGERDFYIQNKAFSEDRKSAKRSARTQAKIARLQGKNDRASDRRAAALAKWQQRNGKSGGSGGSGGSSSGGKRVNKMDVRKAMSYLRSADKGSYSNKRSARDYLINRGVEPRVAKKATKRAQRQARKSKKPNYGFSGKF